MRGDCTAVFARPTTRTLLIALMWSVGRGDHANRTSITVNQDSKELALVAASSISSTPSLSSGDSVFWLTFTIWNLDACSSSDRESNTC